jgi:molybdenum cofactor cytidylyltransferase
VSVAAIILAAGRGTRFGEAPKLLASLHGKALVRHVAEAAVASALSPVIVVTGHRSAEVKAVLKDLPLTIVPNPAYADGLSTSLRAGFAALPEEATAAAILLGDMPLVTPSLLDGLARAWSDERPSALVPVAAGRRGNPVILSRSLAPAIAMLAGDIGAGPLLRGRSDVREWPVEDTAVLQDIDTADALAALKT